MRKPPLSGSLEMALLTLMQGKQCGRKIKTHTLAAPPTKYVADVTLTDVDSIRDFGLRHTASQQVANKVRPVGIHALFYRYRAYEVKRHSDYVVLHTGGMDNLAARLKHARRHKGLNQTQLAKKAGLKNQSIIGSLESGHRKSSTYIPAIAQALGVSALWLSEGKGPMIDTTGGVAPVVSDFDRKLWDQVVWLWNNADPEVMTMFRIMINAAYIKRQADVQAQNVQHSKRPNLELVEDADDKQTGGVG